MAVDDNGELQMSNLGNKILKQRYHTDVLLCNFLSGWFWTKILKGMLHLGIKYFFPFLLTPHQDQLTTRMHRHTRLRWGGGCRPTCGQKSPNFRVSTCYFKRMGIKIADKSVEAPQLEVVVLLMLTGLEWNCCLKKPVNFRCSTHTSSSLANAWKWSVAQC